MRKEILNAMKKINKDFGEGAVVLGSDLPSFDFRIPTGSVTLDKDLGGGIPVGRLTTIAGEFSSCKSFLAYNTIANCQKMRKKKTDYNGKEVEVITEDDDGEPLVAALIQLESMSYTREWGNAIGVDDDAMVFAMPSGMEEAINTAILLQRAGVELIVIDSYAAMVPTKEMETDAGESFQMGIVPKELGAYHRKFQALNNKAEREGRLPTTVIAINQLREKIGGYGDTSYTPGGKSTGYTNTVEVRVRPGDKIAIGAGKEAHVIGKTIKYRITKNKLGIPHKTGEFDFYNDDGGVVPRGHIDTAKELINLALVLGVIEQRGAWFYYLGERLGQGRANVIETVRENEELFSAIKTDLMNPDLATLPAEEEEDEGGIEV